MTTIGDKNKTYGLSLEQWCEINFLPTNYFDLPVQERRDAFKEAQRKLWARDGNPDYFEERLARYRKSKDKKNMNLLLI